MIRSPAQAAPAPLTVAAGLVLVEAIVLLGYALSLLGNIDSRHPQVAITTAIAFVLFAVGLIWCVWAVTQGRSWARSPIILSQLIQLGVAWSFRGGATTLLAIGLALGAVIVLAGMLHPASIDYLSDEYLPDENE
jgi:hypothetical protein